MDPTLKKRAILISGTVENVRTTRMIFQIIHVYLQNDRLKVLNTLAHHLG